MEQQEEKQEEVKVAKVCDNCGSGNMHFEATAWWNIAKQEFEYDLNYDRDYCFACQDQVSTSDVPWSHDRWNNGVDKGDLVNFHPDRVDYSRLDALAQPASSFDWDTLDTALGLVVEVRPDPKRKYAEVRDTVLVRLFTGEDIEVWPRDLIVVGQMESGWELFGEKDDEQKAA